MRLGGPFGLTACLVVGLAACRGEPKGATGGADTAARADSAAPDSIPEERPDTVPSAVTDSTTVLLQLLPAAAGGSLTGDAAALADRAVFAPRTQRWFMARMIDSVPSMDIGRIDGGVGTTDAARAALLAMLEARSPVVPGMAFILHGRTGTRVATVTSLGMSGRRIIARDRKSVV